MREIKDSNIPWAGVIPQKWNVISFSQGIVRMATGLNPRENFVLTKDDEYYYVTIRNFKDGKLYLDDNCDRISREAWEIIQERSDLHKGDILFASISKDGQCYILTEEPSNWNINESVFCIRVNKEFFNEKYFYYHLIDDAYYTDLRMDATGTTFQSIKQNKLRLSKMVMPPLLEQERIADFLDRKCADIDNVLEKTKASIEEYKKLKQSVITEAVTKGVRGSRSMKDSGSTWFGQIPTTWDANKLKYTFTIRKRIVGEDGHTVLAITQKGVKPKDMSNGNGQFAESYANYQIVHPGDFAMNHMDLLTGWVDISQYEGVTSPDYRVFTLDDTTRNCPRYYLYMMQMCYSNRIFYSMGQGVSGMGRWRLPANMFNNFLIPVPPYDEQKEIADYLNTKCAEIDNLISSKEKFISELESYKKSFIYEYVTGKKEVPATI